MIEQALEALSRFYFVIALGGVGVWALLWALEQAVIIYMNWRNEA